MADPVSLKDVHGVGHATASKLRQVGITTIEALAVSPIRKIADKTDTGFEKALQIILEARKLVQADWTTQRHAAMLYWLSEAGCSLGWWNRDSSYDGVDRRVKCGQDADFPEALCNGAVA